MPMFCGKALIVTIRRHSQGTHFRIRQPPAIDHLSIGCADLARAKRFYDDVLATIGCTCIFTVDVPGEGAVTHGYGEIGSLYLGLLKQLPGDQLAD